ncbi:bifunctional UDP-sugar hydrolase/5'-nucleotidase UshA [Shewanella glacialimarina]|jgi:5'-nucleotidase/UDP-sugar diphosphatase|uniref:bifunctional UDP-sugar hydrolase/5'-nucleotidase UshA n=1 Tax=Shewanella glacialimarina TaxID=2590884 RepID=UPI001CF92C66|nr:bifunctional UDP-sugar hydrolase/5'-nucleotidase UshA [Shewanella glacialimarina]UCX04688.1 bifunctional UDP-sugar hydrolase/5'-nucleotidase [Shewanella glacialimarina]
MSKVLIKGMLASAVLVALVGCNSDDAKIPTTCAEAGADCKIFTVLHTNDNHGRFWENSNGEYGMAARKALIDQIRAEVSANGGESILLSGGDINTGVPESDLQDAVPDFIGMNEIRYDAMAVGNHEFDNPLAVLDSQRSIANFPMLAANIYHADGTTRYFEPYKIFDVNGVRIAVIGLTTKDTEKLGNPEYIQDIKFTDPTTEVAKVIAEIKANDKADLIFATTHMGHYADGKNGSNAPGDVAMARALTAGDLHAVIGGHSQNPVCMEPGTNEYADFKPGDDCAPDMQNGTYIMQAHEWGKYVGRADFEYFNGKLNLASYKLIPVNLKKTVEDAEGKKTTVLIGEEIIPDADLKQLLSYYQAKGQGQLGEVIAETDAKLEGDRAIVRGEQTNLGRLIAEAQRTKVSADFSVMNSGGVRASIAAGDISYRDVLTVQPFGNMVTLNTLTGAQVSEYLATVATFQRGSGAYAQITGVKMTVDCAASSVDISEINGETYAADGSYTFTVPSYNAAGGDGYPKLESVQTGYVDAEVLYTYFKDKGMIVAADFAPVGDIVYTNSNSVLGCQLN